MVRVTKLGTFLARRFLNSIFVVDTGMEHLQLILDILILIFCIAVDRRTELSQQCFLIELPWCPRRLKKRQTYLLMAN